MNCINYNIEDIINIFNGFEPIYYGCFTEYEAEYFIDDFIDLEHFSFEMGATKLVLIPKKEDYVIKVPFTGYFDGGTPEDGDYISFYGAEFGNGEDYCQSEIEFYNKIKNSNFKQLFMPLEKIGEYKGVPIYIQPKCETLIEGEENFIYSSEKDRKRIKEEAEKDSSQAKEPVFAALPISWVASLLTVLKDYKELVKFYSFLRKHDFGYDLHIANVGYYNNHAVILDYGGYNS